MLNSLLSLGREGGREGSSKEASESESKEGLKVKGKERQILLEYGVEWLAG